MLYAIRLDLMSSIDCAIERQLLIASKKIDFFEGSGSGQKWRHRQNPTSPAWAATLNCYRNTLKWRLMHDLLRMHSGTSTFERFWTNESFESHKKRLKRCRRQLLTTLKCSATLNCYNETVKRRAKETFSERNRTWVSGLEVKRSDTEPGVSEIEKMAVCPFSWRFSGCFSPDSASTAPITPRQHVSDNF